MYNNGGRHTTNLCLSWSSTGRKDILLLTLLVATFTAAPLLGQQSVPSTAREAATMPEFAARLARNVRPGLTGRYTPQASYKNPANRCARGRSGWLPTDGIVYDNGAINGTTDAWTINFGFAVSNTFTVPSSGASLTGMSFGAWLFPGDVLQSGEVLIGTSEYGGTLSDQVFSLSQSNCSGNQYGFNVCTESGNFTAVNLAGGTYWVTLQNATVNTGDPVYWDENSGPSSASESSVGTIPSEAFTLLGVTTTTTTSCFESKSQVTHDSENYEIIHSFNSNEGSPASGLSIDAHENLFGTASGGMNGDGLAYKLSLLGQSWNFSTLYNFVGGLDGQNPQAATLGPESALYGAASGGLQTCGTSGNQYCGVIFRLRPSPAACPAVLCGWGEQIAYRFMGDPDGWDPNPQLAFDRSGNVYGTTVRGGVYGHGTVFELMPSSGGWTEKVIYNFTGGSDGGEPTSLLMGPDGKLYGTTFFGGNGGGVIFQLARSGVGWAQTVIASLNGCAFSGNGGDCDAVLIQERSGSFYGIKNYSTYLTPYRDLWYLLGQIFVMSPSSSGNWQFGVLADTFNEYCDGYPWCFAAGYATFHGMAISPAGEVYGTSGTYEFCYGGYGDISKWVSGYPEILLRGADAYSDVEVGPSGNIYGTIGPYGGQFGGVWKIAQP